MTHLSYLKIQSIARVAVRYPVLPVQERPKQHNAEHQAWVSEQWEKYGIPVPLVLKVSNQHDFLIEEAIEGTELGMKPIFIINF